MTKEAKDAAIFVRMSQSEIDRLDALTERYTFLSRSDVARQAMRLGVDLIEREGLTVLEPPARKRMTKGARR